MKRFTVTQWDDLNEDMRTVRREVFIEEQCIPLSEEFTGDDDQYIHFCAYDETGVPVGTARGKQVGNSFFIGRVAVKKEYRKYGLGRTLMTAAEAYGKKEGCTVAELHAQISAVGFYARLGYVPFGETYYEVDIPHIGMRKGLSQ